MRMDPLLSRVEDRDQWRTPLNLFSQLNKEFQFTCDVACNESNALLPNRITDEDNAFLCDWTGRCWCNPPYSDIGPWIRKGHESVTSGNAEVVVFLVPARTGTDWFHRYALQHEIRFLRGRLRFSGCRTNAPFDCCLIIMKRDAERGIVAGGQTRLVA